MRDGYKAAKGRQSIRGGYEPVKGAEKSVVKAGNKPLRVDIRLLRSYRA